MTEIKLTLPAPPSINRLWRVRGSIVYKTKLYTDYKQAVMDVVKKSGYLNLKLETRLYYEAVYYPPDKRKRDIDNFCSKALLDSLTSAGVYVDDSQIDIIHYQRGPVVKDGKIEIIIREIE